MSICKFDNVQSSSIVLIFCVTAAYCSLLYLCNWEKKKNSRSDYNNKQTCNNVLVKNIVVIDLSINQSM